MYYVYSQAKNRDVALLRLTRLADSFNDHIIKCVVFGNTTNNLDHWCKELGNFLNIANKTKLKSTHNKVDLDTLYDTLFCNIGDGDLDDAESNLGIFQIELGYKYPEFEITPELIRNLSDIYREFLQIGKNVVQKNNYTLQDLQQQCRNLFT